MHKTIILLSLILTLSSCNNIFDKSKGTNIEKKEVNKVQEVKTNSGTIENEKKANKKETININKNANTYVGFVGTFCPHCQKEMPILDEFYKENKWKVNMLMVVIDNKKFEWYSIPQKKQEELSNMTYEKLTWEKCGYVPSYVIYDKNKKILTKKCGWALDKEWLKVAMFKNVKNDNSLENNTSTWKVEKETSSLENSLEKEGNKEEAKKNNLDTKINKNMEAKKWSKVKVNYIWKTKEDWKEFDNSYKRGETLDFTVWAWQMIKGFDEWVVWMKVWDKKTIEIAPEDAYGVYDKNKVKVFDKKDLADFEKHWIKLEVGSELPTQMWMLKIIKTDDKTVTVDLNHPLAWKTLIFEVEMVEVK